MHPTRYRERERTIINISGSYGVAGLKLKDTYLMKPVVYNVGTEKTMNQGNFDVVNAEMSRLNVNILGTNEMM